MHGAYFSFKNVSGVESVEILSMTGPVTVNSGNDVTLDCYYNYRYEHVTQSFTQNHTLTKG